MNRLDSKLGLTRAPPGLAAPEARARPERAAGTGAEQPGQEEEREQRRGAGRGVSVVLAPLREEDQQEKEDGLALQERQVTVSLLDVHPDHDVALIGFFSAERFDVPPYEEMSLYNPQPNQRRPLILVGPPSIGRHELRLRLLEDVNRFAAAVPRKQPSE